MGKKYKTEPEGNMLRIIALRDFSDVKRGDKGGLIDKEDNLSQEGDCWIYGNARVFGYAEVYEDSKVSGNARVFGLAKIFGNAKVYGNAMVYENAWVYGSAKISGNARVCGNARVRGDVKLYSTNSTTITASIESNEDYVILAFKKDFYVTPLPSKILTIAESLVDYVKNIQTIRQLYGEEI